VIRRLVARATAAAAILAAAGVAVALPPADRPQGPAPALTRATAPLAHANSRSGQAVLTAANLKPGDTRAGEVTIANHGHAGALYLVAHPADDSPGPRLSDRLTVTITGPSGRTVAAGALGATARCHPLGRFAAGESRTYRFEVAFPSGGASDNAYAGATTRVDYEWLETGDLRDACPDRADETVDLPETAVPGDLHVGDMRLAIEPGPYRFGRRSGTARVGIRCIEGPADGCTGRLELERARRGQGRGIALAVGRFSVPAGGRRTVRLRLNARARRRIAAHGVVPVRAFVIARDASGRVHRVAYRDKLVYRR
jgi:hypothetical protein